MRKRKKKKRLGRPLAITQAVVSKLEHAFSLDATVGEACFYANISRETFYDYSRKNPDFSDKMERMRQNPVLKARETIVTNLNDATHAKWYLERKAKKEFGNAPQKFELVPISPKEDREKYS